MIIFFVGDQGAKVPLPIRINDDMQKNIIINPDRIKIDPRRKE
jgi:hypothetical protein